MVIYGWCCVYTFSFIVAFHRNGNTSVLETHYSVYVLGWWKVSLSNSFEMYHIYLCLRLPLLFILFYFILSLQFCYKFHFFRVRLIDYKWCKLHSESVYVCVNGMQLKFHCIWSGPSALSLFEKLPCYRILSHWLSKRWKSSYFQCTTVFVAKCFMQKWNCVYEWKTAIDMYIMVAEEINYNNNNREREK